MEFKSRLPFFQVWYFKCALKRVYVLLTMDKLFPSLCCSCVSFCCPSFPCFHHTPPKSANFVWLCRHAASKDDDRSAGLGPEPDPGDQTAHLILLDDFRYASALASEKCSQSKYGTYSLFGPNNSRNYVRGTCLLESSWGTKHFQGLFVCTTRRNRLPNLRKLASSWYTNVTSGRLTM